jgi:hypothetical protein
MDNEPTDMVDNPELKEPGATKNGSFVLANQLVQWKLSTSGWWMTGVQGFRNTMWLSIGKIQRTKVESPSLGPEPQIYHLVIGPLSLRWGRIG